MPFLSIFLSSFLFLVPRILFIKEGTKLFNFILSANEQCSFFFAIRSLRLYTELHTDAYDMKGYHSSSVCFHSYAEVWLWIFI